MSAHHRRSLARAVVLFAALWPPGQMLLAHHFEANPARAGAWGTHAAVNVGSPELEIFGWRTDGRVRESLNAPTRGMVLAADTFLRDFAALGMWTSPDALADDVLDHHPEWERIEIIVFAPYLDHATAMVETRRRTFEYRREPTIR